MPCLTPRILKSETGANREFACQKCSECRKGRVRDLTGRCLAEAKFCVGASFVTLTYGKDVKVDGASDVDGAVVLTYSHVQKWIRRFRDAGFPLRYVVAGEYGSKKGRGHWHCILYWTERVPPVPEHSVGSDGRSRAWNDPWWSPYHNGHTQWADVDAGTARYIAKYMVKNEDDPHGQTIVRRSTVPLIGAKYFEYWARKHVDQGLPISNRYYQIAGSIDKTTGKPWNYYMTDAALAYVLESYKEQWQARYGVPGTATFVRHMPTSDFMERGFDKLCVRPAVMGLTRPRRRRLAEWTPREVWNLPPEKWPEGIWFDEAVQTYVWDQPGGRLFYSYRPDGKPGWSMLLTRPSVAAAKRRELAGDSLAGSRFSD